MGCCLFDGLFVVYFWIYLLLCFCELVLPLPGVILFWCLFLDWLGFAVAGTYIVLTERSLLLLEFNLRCLCWRYFVCSMF